MKIVLTITTRPLNSTRRERDDLADQLYQQLKEAIVTNRARPGETLPTIASISEELGIATSTIMTAFRALANENLVKGERSQGTVVIGPTKEATADIAEAMLTPVLEQLRKLDLSGKEAREVFERAWNRWFSPRKGDRRAGSDPHGDVRSMSITIQEERRAGAERRAIKRTTKE